MGARRKNGEEIAGRTEVKQQRRKGESGGSRRGEATVGGDKRTKDR